jgi:uncharacterized membrane protein
MTVADQPNAVPTLPAHIEEAVQAIARLHSAHRQGASPVQRAVDGLTATFGRPRAAGALAVLAAGWIALNLALTAGGRPALDPPPFMLLQTTAGLTALFVTIFILITQRREDELSELREQLTLELAMMSEQKAAKIIALLEELRRDLPSVHDRFDLEAHALAKPADPEAVLTALKDTRGAPADTPPAGDDGSG